MRNREDGKDCMNLGLELGLEIPAGSWVYESGCMLWKILGRDISLEIICLIRWEIMDYGLRTRLVSLTEKREIRKRER